MKKDHLRYIIKDLEEFKKQKFNIDSLSPNVINQELDECKKILSSIGLTFDINKIISSSRKTELVVARCLIVKLLRTKGYSLHKVGKIINRDHATVIHAEKHFNKIKSSNKYADIVNSLIIAMYHDEVSDKINMHINQIIALLPRANKNTRSYIMARLKTLKSKLK